MKKKKFFPLSMGIGFLFTGLFCCFSVSADAVEGSPGQTVSGEYAVVINTDTSSPQNTGTLVLTMVQILSLLISALAAAQPICLRPRFSKKLLTPVIIMFFLHLSFLHLSFPQQLHSLLPQVTTSGRKNISIVQIVQAKLMYASALVNTAISGWIKI